MAPKKPVKPTKLQVKAGKKDKVLTGPKGSKPQSTTTNRVRTQGGTTMSKPAPSAGRRINPKAAKPKAPSRPQSAYGTNIPVDKNGWPKGTSKWAEPKGTAKPKAARPSLGNVKPGPAAAAAPRQQAQAQGQANVRAAQLRRQQLMAANQRRAVAKGGTGAAIAGAVLNAPAEFKKLQALHRNPKGALSRASSDILSGKPYDPQTVTKASKPPTPKPAAPKGPTPAQRTEWQTQETKARRALDARKKAAGSKEATPNTAASFDDAFKDARRAKVKTFTWRGKKYTTEMK